ncbi:MAG: helix-turn-helix transcriptional regulator [Bacillota bacterium]
MSDLGNKKVLAKNLVYYMQSRGKDRNAICADLNIKYTTFADWENARTYPRIDKIELLANYFGIQKSDLIEDKAKLSASDKLYETLEQTFRSLSPSTRTQALDYMRYLAEREKSEQ